MEQSELENIPLNSKMPRKELKKEKTDFLKLLMGLIIVILLCFLSIAKNQSSGLSSMAEISTQAFEGYEDVEGEEQSLETFKNIRLNLTSYNNEQAGHRQTQKQNQSAVDVVPEPKKQDRRILSVVIVSQKTVTLNHCVIMNGLSLVTAVSVNSIWSLFAQLTKKVVVLIDANDKLSLDVLMNAFQGRVQLIQEQPDSQYQLFRGLTLGCAKVAFVQSKFTLNTFKLKGKMTQLPAHGLAYSQKVIINQKLKKLNDLKLVTLEDLAPSYLSSYLFIFDPVYLSFITPLNYGYYNKFSVEEMLILPILALLQDSTHLIPLNSTLHSFDSINFANKQFALSPNPTITDATHHMCVVSHPSNPYTNSETQFLNFYNNLQAIKDNNFSVVIGLPLTKGVWDSFKHIMDYNSFREVRVRLWANKTAMSLLAYESAHTYCPSQAIMVTSRFNIRFHQNFATLILNSVSEEHHYYTAEFNNSEGEHIDFGNISPYSVDYRLKALYFDSHLKHLQIFKSDLLKMYYLFILKSDEIDFYITEASFVFPMFETIQGNVRKVEQVLFSVEKRRNVELEGQQIKNLGLYQQWPKAEMLTPKSINSLENPAFRKKAPQLIQRNLHQIWINNKQPSELQMKLLQTLRRVNPTFTFYLWRMEHISWQNFPLTYSLIEKSLQYSDTNSRSFKAPIATIMRYEAIYQHGGISTDFMIQSLRPLDPFLKYPIFFTDCSYTYGQEPAPWVGNVIMGATKRNYHLTYLLNSFLGEDIFSLTKFETPKIMGGQVVRSLFTHQQLLQWVGFGFHLFLQRGDQHSECALQTQFSNGQEVYGVNVKGREYKIGIPCRLYPQSYSMVYFELEKASDSGPA